MTKKLNVDQIQSELSGSVFFPSRKQEPEEEQTEAALPIVPDVPPTDSVAPTRTSTRPVRQRESGRERGETASKASSKQASKQASTLDIVSAQRVEAIRKIVKIAGKEVSYVRLTPGEKDELADIIYAYKRRGTKITENEISRIAVNYVLADYKENGDDSVLARVLDALRA